MNFEEQMTLLEEIVFVGKKTVRTESLLRISWRLGFSCSSSIHPDPVAEIAEESCRC